MQRSKEPRVCLDAVTLASILAFLPFYNVGMLKKRRKNKNKFYACAMKCHKTSPTTTVPQEYNNGLWLCATSYPGLIWHSAQAMRSDGAWVLYFDFDRMAILLPHIS